MAKKTLIQSHARLAMRLDRMVADLLSREKLTDEEKAAVKQLQDQAADHVRKCRLTGDICLMIIN